MAFTDGVGPLASLIVSNNILYGTTHNYGGGIGGGDGSVFKLNTDGTGFTNLHTFSGYPPEGGALLGDLLLVGGALYGTTAQGGSNGYGCIFSIGTNGLNLTNIFNFEATAPSFPYTNSTGASPSAGLLLIGGTLYGGTGGGGLHAAGTLFAINTNGTGFMNLHSFTVTDGQYLRRDLILSGGTLYGTTPGGGSSAVGTIFKMNTNGSGYTNFYTFPNDSNPSHTNSDGAFPACQLVLVGNTLFGTASEGGDFGNGTIFTIDTNGNAFTLLHTFSATNGVGGTNADGAQPQGGLALVGNTLYGTAASGGTGGNGVVFKLNLNGSGFTTLYSFSATNGPTGTNSDGAQPVAALVQSGNALYGTASLGGTNGSGAVFRIALPPTLAITFSGTNAILAWPSNAVGFSLQVSTNLAGTWNPLAGQFTVTNPISGRQKFYRLTSP